MQEITTQPTGDAPALEIDLDVYLPLFEDESISDADKRKLLEALWSIIMSFAQLGWGVHPVQQAKASRAACGQVSENAPMSPLLAEFMIGSEGSQLTENIECAADDGGGKG